MIPLSFQIDDPNLTQLRERYVAYILQHQDNSGWLGPPVSPNSTAKEYWGKYDAIQALEYYAEGNASAMPLVKAALMRHHSAFFKALTNNNPRLNESRWGVDRYSDGLVGIQWLLDHGEGDTPGTAWLWDLQRIFRTRCDALMAEVDHTWESWFASDPGFKTGSTSPFKQPNAASADTATATAAAPADPTGFMHLLRHGVDIGQAMKTGPLWWRVDGDEADRMNPSAALEWADAYLHRADGMYWADEEVDGLTSPSRGTETCSIVETMFSMRTAYEVTGNISYMDRLEKIAFNALPAALWPDATTNVYHHANNQIETGPGGPYAYDLYFCCSANVHQGWPKWLLSAVHLQGSSTIVISGYAPTSSTLSDGTTVGVGGSYPFSDNATITVSRAARLRLRIPCWSASALVRVGTGGETLTAPACAFFNVTTTAATTVTVIFKNEINLHEWTASSLDGQSLTKDGGIEVHRGPLLYALRPASHVDSTGAVAPKDVLHTYPSSLPGGGCGWPHMSRHQVTIVPNTSWNFGLLLDSLAFEETGQPVPTLPFDAIAPPPVRITAKGQVIPGWTTAGGARGIAALPQSPLSSTSPVEDLVLVPYVEANNAASFMCVSFVNCMLYISVRTLASPQTVVHWCEWCQSGMMCASLGGTWGSRYGSTNIRISVFPQLCKTSSSNCPPPPPPGQCEAMPAHAHRNERSTRGCSHCRTRLFAHTPHVPAHGQRTNNNNNNNNKKT